MLLTISTTLKPATDLGYLLHKHPDRCQSFDLPFGRAHVFYPEAGADRCTAALLLDVNLIDLKRKPRRTGFALESYVNDRPYTASSFLSVAIGRVFSSALNGRCQERPDLVRAPLPLEVSLSVVPSRGEADLIERLFQPLGYDVDVVRHALDAAFPAWGDSPYCSVVLRKTATLQDLLNHLYVLVPVLDDDKHYFVGDEEVDKLLRHGSSWLSEHPERALIAERYLKHQRLLTRDALSRLLAGDDAGTDADTDGAQQHAMATDPSLRQQRLDAVLGVLRDMRAQRVVDLGCGDGALLQALVREGQFTQILGMDVSDRALSRAARRLRIDRDLAPASQHAAPRSPVTVPSSGRRQRLGLIQGSLAYRDTRLAGYDAAVLMEVIEHIDPPRLPTFERVVFETARPGSVVVTTPNVEYNARWERLPGGEFRHRDHRFEWSRSQFSDWCGAVASRYGYAVDFHPVGPQDAEVGSPTQMAVFRLREPT